MSQSVPLSESHINQLIQQGCTSSDWSCVTVASRADLSRLRHVEFRGAVTVGDTGGTVVVDGVEWPCGIYNACLVECTIGNHVRIANVGSFIANYRIEDEAIIQNVAALTAEKNASFGIGTEVDVWNEGGGRTTIMVDALTAQTAYLQAARRHNPELLKRMKAILHANVAGSTIEHGVVGHGARLLHCGTIRNVNIGPAALLHGIQHLENGTIMSCVEHPTIVGSGVQATSFVMSEGARVESGVLLDKVFVGQGVKMGKQFSAENSLFFANCEAFHGEAVSLFAGPYCVTHHKSTLLIAGLFSFSNAGSGSNQSNHMYKLGPVHQGVFERGCKTGSFSYVMLESHIGAFSVVIGKHTANINTPNLPFSHIYEEGGVSKIVPGMNLYSVGTVRDGEKWPRRDNRKAPVKRDLIIFDVFSPYTVEKMRRGRDELKRLHESTPKEKASVTYGGVQISRAFLRKGAKYYEQAVRRYLTDRVCARIEESLRTNKDWEEAVATLRSDSDLQKPMEWTDIAGLLTPRERLEALESKVVSEHIRTYEEVLEEFRSMAGLYRSDEWAYVHAAWLLEYGMQPESMTRERALEAMADWQKAARALHTLILEDSKKEFGAFARIGYGLDMPEENARHDFQAVRGSTETHPVVRNLMEEDARIDARMRAFEQLLASV